MAPNSLSIPVVGVSVLYRGCPAETGLVARAIGSACREVGFFCVAGHRVPPRLIADAFEHARAFFALPADGKEAVSIARSRHNRGYVAIEGEALDPLRPPDLKEAFNIGLELPPDDPEVVAGRPFRGVNMWPQIEGFRGTMLAYYDALWMLGRLLHRAIAIDLGLAEDYFEDKLDRPMATLRLLHYPPAPADGRPGQLGAGEHTDYGNITLLATDGTGGLEVRTRSGEWIAAPAVEGAFLCNIGDCLMRWTNDTYVSTPHRVLARPGRERYSIAFFLDPNPGTVVSVLPTCTTPDRPARYPPTTAAEFLQSRLAPTYGRNVPKP